MREMKDSAIEFIGQIPNNWSVYKNKHLFNSDKIIVGEKFRNHQLLSLTTKGVIKKDINNPNGKLPGSFSTYQSVEKNDLIMCLFDLDVSAVFSGISIYPGMISPAYKIISCNERLHPKYAYYWFKMVGNDRSYLLYSKSLRNTINADNFKEIPTITPSIEEQKIIATYLDDKFGCIDNIIRKAKESIKEYKKYKQSLITETVTKGFNPDVKMKDSGIEWIGEIPEHWDVIKLRFLGSLQNGISKSGDQFGKGAPFVSYGDAYKNYELPYAVNGLVLASETDKVNYSILKSDVLFTRTSETIEEIGFASTCTKTIKEATFAGFLIRFRLYNLDDMDNYFSKYFFRSDMHRRFFVKEMNLVTRASLSQELLKRLPVLMPPIEEQQAIGLFLEQKCTKLDSIIQLKSNFINDMEAYKKSLIYEVVTGKKTS